MVTVVSTKATRFVYGICAKRKRNHLFRSSKLLIHINFFVCYFCSYTHKNIYKQFSFSLYFFLSFVSSTVLVCVCVCFCIYSVMPRKCFGIIVNIRYPYPQFPLTLSLSLCSCQIRFDIYICKQILQTRNIF